MFTTQDERNGLVKTTWKAIRDRVFHVEPEFTRLVDILNPDHSFAVYLAYYPYGAMDADTQSTLFPRLEGGTFRLTDGDVPAEIINDLGYSTNNTPLGMVLEKQIESFIDLKRNDITIPFRIYSPGSFFPVTKILNHQPKRTYAPYKLLCSVAGARSVFMLPNIGSAVNHAMLQRDYKIKSPTPKNLYDHWQVFRDIANSQVVNSDWRCCVLYFSAKWLQHIHHEKSWMAVKEYLNELAWKRYDYEINRVHYDMIFSIIQQNRNLKPNPYLSDTAKHLFTIALGKAPGYAPAINDNALPLDIMEEAFSSSYQLKKYKPIIMQPNYFDFEKSKHPIYYSLQNPSTLVFSPRSRTQASTLQEMRELEHLMTIFSKELAQEDGMCSINSVVNTLAKKIKLTYFHSKCDSHQIIQHSSHMPKEDERFSANGFAADGTFVRGCVRIML